MNQPTPKKMITPTNPNARYWVCIIGPIEQGQLPIGADLPPRMAARNAVIEMTGDGEAACTSGWCGEAEYQRIMDAKYGQNAPRQLRADNTTPKAKRKRTAKDTIKWKDPDFNPLLSKWGEFGEYFSADVEIDPKTGEGTIKLH